MANVILTQVLERREKFIIVKYTITGDGSGEFTLEKLFDNSLYNTNVNNKIYDIEYDLNGFSAELFWDATAPVALTSLSASHPYNANFILLGGLKNNGGTGQTGDILMTTTGLGAAETGHILFRISWR